MNLSFTLLFEKDTKLMEELKEIITYISPQIDVYENNNEKEQQIIELLTFSHYISCFRKLYYKYDLIKHFIDEIDELHSYILGKARNAQYIELEPEDYNNFLYFNNWIKKHFFDLNTNNNQDTLKDIEHENLENINH